MRGDSVLLDGLIYEEDNVVFLPLFTVVYMVCLTRHQSRVIARQFRVTLASLQYTSFESVRSNCAPKCCTVSRNEQASTATGDDL